jgi:hypothetical protein
MPHLFRFRFFILCILIGYLITSCSPANERQETEKADPSIVSLFKGLDRNSDWKLINDNLLEFTTYHTQGMAKWNGHYFLSSVEIRVRTEPMEDDPQFDRTTGEGEGHLFKFDENGERIQSITLSDGAKYHPGGIDYGEGFIWVPVAEYRPNSSSVIYKVHPETMEFREMFRLSDHIGAVIFDSDAMVLYGYSWGSRRIYSWELDETLNLKNPDGLESASYVVNTQHYIDYQDCQNLGNHLAICSGLSSYQIPFDSRSFALGGLELIDLKTLQPVYQIPVEHYTTGENLRVMTQNPFFIEESGDNLHIHFIPEDDESRHYIYEVSAIQQNWNNRGNSW